MYNKWVALGFITFLVIFSFFVGIFFVSGQTSNYISVTTNLSPTFTIIFLPDPQYYSEKEPEIFTKQTQWIVDNVDDMNIVFVATAGDFVVNANVAAEWENANNAMSLLDDVVPYAVLAGNHDMYPMNDPTATTEFNNYFPYTRYVDKSWYGGHYGDNNDNNYQLISASGLNFIIINLEYNVEAATLTWANALLNTYSDRRAIVVAHSVLDGKGNFDTNGQNIYNALKANSNLFLILAGHVSKEDRRVDTYETNTVNTLLANYQWRLDEQGNRFKGNGRLRIMEFRPNENKIYIKTYSPYLDQYETDANSQFTIDYDMTASK